MHELDVVGTADGVEGVVLDVAVSGAGCLADTPGGRHCRNT